MEETIKGWVVQRGTMYWIQGRRYTKNLSKATILTDKKPFDLISKEKFVPVIRTTRTAKEPSNDR